MLPELYGVQVRSVAPKVSRTRKRNLNRVVAEDAARPVWMPGTKWCPLACRRRPLCALLQRSRGCGALSSLRVSIRSDSSPSAAHNFSRKLCVDFSAVQCLRCGARVCSSPSSAASASLSSPSRCCEAAVVQPL